MGSLPFDYMPSHLNNTGSVCNAANYLCTGRRNKNQVQQNSGLDNSTTDEQKTLKNRN